MRWRWMVSIYATWILLASGVGLLFGLFDAECKAIPIAVMLFLGALYIVAIWDH